MAPTIKIQQIILPNVVDDVNFIRVPKMDRCHDVPSGDRQEGLREVSAAVHDAPEPGSVSRQRLAAPDRPGRLHGVPRGHGPVGQLPRRGAHAVEREAEGRVGEEVPLGRAAPVGLPDAADEDDGGVVREVPQAEGLHPEGRRAERRLRDVRARRLLRLPQDEGLRHERPEARADPHEDRARSCRRTG